MHREKTWPVEPGEYSIGDPESSLAISTLSDQDLYENLVSLLDKRSYAILGATKTPNIGVEKLIRNIVYNDNICCLVLVGEDKSDPPISAVILAVHRYGTDKNNRVIGLRKKLHLHNLDHAEITEFRSRIRILDATGLQNPEKIASLINEALNNKNCSECRSTTQLSTVVKPKYRIIEATEDEEVVLDKRGFFIIHVDRASHKIICEHYDVTGKKTTEIRGTKASAIYKTAIKLGLISRLDHAAYLGKELARAECALALGERYEQDKA